MKALRLMRQHGQPTTSTANERFFRKIAELEEQQSEAEMDIVHGRLNRDPEILYRGIGKLESVATLMGEAKREWWRSMRS